MDLRTYASIDLDALEFNFNSVRSKVPSSSKILGVIKADAYGHGAVEIGKFLDDKCDFFGVACIEEAVQLKKSGIKTPILILGYVFENSYDLVVKYDVRIPVFSLEMAQALSAEAVKQNKTIPFHFCVDTGMSRIGFQVSEESADICKQISQLDNIYPEGLFSHFATADEEDLTRALKQQNKYIKFVSMLEDRKINIPIKHINNSAGIMNFQQCFDMCRMGIVTYGLYPSDMVDPKKLPIKPLMQWKTRISYIKLLEKGREVSYGGTYKLDKDLLVATVPVGYADGYPRCLSNIGKVIVNGEFANIIGRVCMDQFMIDVSHISGVKIGTTVTLIGSDGDKVLSMEEVANKAHSFNYELPCRIARRVPRVYIKNGEIVKTTNYLY